MTCRLSKNKRSAAEHCVNLSFIGRWTDRGTGSLRQQNALAFDTAERERGGDRVEASWVTAMRITTVRARGRRRSLRLARSMQ